jgi:hypothetical protein
MRAMKIQLEEVASKNNASVLVAAQLVTGSPVDWYFLIDALRRFMTLKDK